MTGGEGKKVKNRYYSVSEDGEARMSSDIHEIKDILKEIVHEFKSIREDRKKRSRDYS